MARTQEITLPWQPTVDGAVAELGAVFRVELVGGDWQCAVKSGRGRTVIAKGLKSQKDAKRHAETHAATMPEVHDAVSDDAADARPGAKKREAPKRSKRPEAKSHKTAAAPAPEPAPAAAPDGSAPLRSADGGPSITFQQTEDGCLCGKTQGVCWVANAGEIALARPLPQSTIDQIRDAVAQHYAAQRAAAEAPRTRAAAPRAAKKAAKKTAKIRPQKDPTPPRASASKPKPASKPGPAKEAKPPPAKGRKSGRGRASKPKAAKPARGKAKEDAPVAVKSDKPARAPATAKTPSKAPETPAAPTGPIVWSDVEGKPRGIAAHGTFLIEPEGQAFGLYFSDASGQSRHLRSGPLPELRRAAEEYAARGEPAPLRDAPSREQDEALMRIFASGAVEGA